MTWTPNSTMMVENEKKLGESLFRVIHSARGASRSWRECLRRISAQVDAGVSIRVAYKDFERWHDLTLSTTSLAGYRIEDGVAEGGVDALRGHRVVWVASPPDTLLQYGNVQISYRQGFVDIMVDSAAEVVKKINSEEDAMAAFSIKES